MSQDSDVSNRNSDVSKRKGKAATPHAAIKTTDKGEITLTEDELGRVSGGIMSPRPGGRG